MYVELLTSEGTRSDRNASETHGTSQRVSKQLLMSIAGIVPCRILALPWMFGLFNIEAIMTRGRVFIMDSNAA